MAAAAAQLESPRSVCRIGRTHVGVLAAVVAAHAPLVAVHLQQVWHRPHYSFALLLVPVVGWLMRERWPRRQPYVPAKRLERLLLCGSFCGLACGIWLYSPYLATASAILATGFSVLHIAGLRAVPALFGTWMLLWLVVPPPLGLDLLLISRMQALTSQLSSLMLDLVGVNHVMAGNSLHLETATLFVDDACSGVHSLFALVGCTAVFAVMRRRTVRHGIVLLASSLGWAVLLNLFRVLTIALARVWWDADLATGWPHQMLGTVTFLLALGLMLSMDQWLQFVGYGVSQATTFSWRRRADAERLRSRPSSSHASRHLGTMRDLEQTSCRRASASRSNRRTALIAYGVLFATAASSWGRGDSGTDSWTNLSLTPFSRSLLPDSHGRWVQQGFHRIERSSSSPLGRSSIVWTYDRTPSDVPSESCRISLDAPFSGWHELPRCYEGNGWQIDAREIRVDAEDPSVQWVESQLSRATGEHAVLVFGMMREDGRRLTPPPEIGTARLIDRLQDKPTLQIQGFLKSDEPISKRQIDELQTLVRMTAARTAAKMNRPQGGDVDG